MGSGCPPSRAVPTMRCSLTCIAVFVLALSTTGARSAPLANATAYNSTLVDALNCHSINSRATTTWCNANCNHNPPYCPAGLCKCSAGPPPPPPKETVCLHHEDSHKCYEACSTSKFAMKGFTSDGRCEAKYSAVDSTVNTYQCPDGVTNIKYCLKTILEVTVVTKGIGRR